MKTRLFHFFLTKFPPFTTPPSTSLFPSLFNLATPQQWLVSTWHPKMTLSFPDSSHLEFHPSLLPFSFLLHSLSSHPSCPFFLRHLNPPPKLILRHKLQLLPFQFIQHELKVIDLSHSSFFSNPPSTLNLKKKVDINTNNNTNNENQVVLFQFQSPPLSFLSLLSFLWFSSYLCFAFTLLSMLLVLVPQVSMQVPLYFLLVYSFLFMYFASQAPSRLNFTWQPSLFLHHLRCFMLHLITFHWNHVEEWDELCQVEWVSNQELRIIECLLDKVKEREKVNEKENGK